jgi:DMSO/TMAO reductase YedYZ heme-binding membrane subunit
MEHFENASDLSNRHYYLELIISQIGVKTISYEQSVDFFFSPAILFSQMRLSASAGIAKQRVYLRRLLGKGSSSYSLIHSITMIIV